MTPLNLYRQQAAKEQDAADAATLDNVRDRSRRAAAAWTRLASQLEYADELRSQRHAAIEADRLTSEPSENPDRGRSTATHGLVPETKRGPEMKEVAADG